LKILLRSNNVTLVVHALNDVH